MAIKSYLIYPQQGKKESLLSKLASMNACSIIPSTSHDIIVLVTDTKAVAEEKALEEQLNSLTDIKNRALVAGYNV